MCSGPNSGCRYKVEFWIKQLQQQLPLVLLKLHCSLKPNRRFTFQSIKEQRGLAAGLATRDFRFCQVHQHTNTVHHLCLSMEEPSLDEFKIHSLLIRITSEKPTKRPLSSLKFCSHCRSSQKYPLPAADTCFVGPEMELHQRSWSKKTSCRSSWSLSFVLSFGAAVHRLSGAPAKTVAKLFSTIKVGLKNPKLSCSKMLNMYWKETPFGAVCGKYICERQCYSHANIAWVPRSTCQSPVDSLDRDLDI